MQRLKRQRKSLENFKSIEGDVLYKKFKEHVTEKGWFSAGGKPCAVAVSGGGDSVALALMLVTLLGAENVHILHFDHGLRDESASEALWVTSLFSKMGVQVSSQRWVHEGECCDVQGGSMPSQSPPMGNIQQAARQARYAFFKEVCIREGLPFVCIAHNLDDVAETFLMRLGRGSGLKGLACMEEEAHLDDLSLLRPLLFTSRAEIRAFLKSVDAPHMDDPSNENEKFFRIRVRGLQSELAKAGVTFESIVATVKSLKRAEKALDSWAENLFESVFVAQADGYVLDFDFQALDEEVALRVLEKTILKVAPAPLAPRTSKRLHLLHKMQKGERKMSLGGVFFEKVQYGSGYWVRKG